MANIRDSNDKKESSEMWVESEKKHGFVAPLHTFVDDIIRPSFLVFFSLSVLSTTRRIAEGEKKKLIEARYYMFSFLHNF